MIFTFSIHVHSVNQNIIEDFMSCKDFNCLSFVVFAFSLINYFVLKSLEISSFERLLLCLSEIQTDTIH